MDKDGFEARGSLKGDFVSGYFSERCRIPKPLLSLLACAFGRPLTRVVESEPEVPVLELRFGNTWFIWQICQMANYTCHLMGTIFKSVRFKPTYVPAVWLSLSKSTLGKTVIPEQFGTVTLRPVVTETCDACHLRIYNVLW